MFELIGRLVQLAFACFDVLVPLDLCSGSARPSLKIAAVIVGAAMAQLLR